MDPSAVIPHRPPILCIDRIVEVDDEHAITEQVARGSWECWLIEGLAQTAAVLNKHDEKRTGAESTKGMLVGVRKFDIIRPPRDGEVVTLRIDLIRRITPLTLMRAEARVGDELLASGELKFYVELPEQSE